MRTDLHFHLLPGVDDGPASLEESVELARAAAAEGTRAIVATPHVRGDFVTDVRELPGLVRAAVERLGREGLALTVHRGGELGHDMVGRLTQSELDLVALGPPGSRWLLVETPFEGLHEEVHDALDELRDRGFGVVLGHPERCAGLLDGGAGGLRRELERGVLLQVNAQSLLGRHGALALAQAKVLLAEGRVAVVASDAHSLARPPSLGAGADAATSLGASAAAARTLTTAAPARLLERGIPAPVPLPA